jgi:transglutaminase-like putative cysteine protease
VGEILVCRADEMLGCVLVEERREDGCEVGCFEMNAWRWVWLGERSGRRGWWCFDEANGMEWRM